MPLIFQCGSNDDNPPSPSVSAAGSIVPGSAADTGQSRSVLFEISADKLRGLVESLQFANDGDPHEQQYWPILKERFPNCERFWQQLVVPLTRRIECERDDPKRYERRDVADDVWTIGYLNYSLFLHLTATYDHLPCPLHSSFGDFYTHLGSACDLAEDFLLKVYLAVGECTDQPIPALQALSKEECLEMAARWYDTEYPKAYENYHRKGKSKPLYLPPRAAVIDGYFAGEKETWKAYTTFAQRLRTYRNRIVHDVAMGNVLVGKVHLVPRKERITEYQKLQDVFDAANDPMRLKADFIVREEQMVNDCATFRNTSTPFG